MENKSGVIKKSTAARVGPRQSGPPDHIPGQRDFMLDVLRQAGDEGISKNQFREGSHPLLGGRKVAQPDSRVCELERSGYIFEHVKGRDVMVTYILRAEPLGATAQKGVSLSSLAGSRSIDPKPAQDSLFADTSTSAFQNYETGRVQ